jgi:hypothetical protein
MTYWKKCKFEPIKKKTDFLSDEDVTVPVDGPIEADKYEKIGLLKKVKNLGSSLYSWNKEGRPLRSAEEIADIYDNVCAKCPFFKKDHCGLCGCGIKRDGTFLNKLAFATESCPDNPSRWGPNSMADKQRIKLI